MTRRYAWLAAFCLGVGGCAPDAPPPAAPALTPLQQQQFEYTQRAVDGFLQTLLGDGHTPSNPCRPTAPESVRLTFLDQRYQRAFSVAVSENQDGALAVWDEVQRDAKSGALSLGHRRGMQLDVNGWRQVRQAVTDTRFRTLAPGAFSAGPPRFGSGGGVWMIESCLRGQYSLAVRDLPYRQQDEDFARAARTIVRLAGSVSTFGEHVGP